MRTVSRELYTFYGARPEQVDDLLDIWRESVVDWNRSLGMVSVESDPVSIEQFLMFYKLYEYLDYGQQNDNIQGVWVDLHHAEKKTA